MAESAAYQEEETAFGSSPEPVYCHPNIPDDRMNETPTWKTLEMPGTTQPDVPSREFDSVWWEPSQATDFNPFEGLEGVPRPGFPRTSQRSLSNQSSCLGQGRSSSPQAEHCFYNPGEPVEFFCQVQVEQKYVGSILGVSGRTIRKIAKENQVKMAFDQSTWVDPCWSCPLCTLYIRPWWFTNLGRARFKAYCHVLPPWTIVAATSSQSVALKLMIFSMPQAAMTTTLTTSSSAKARSISC